MFKGISNREFDLIKIWAYFNTAKIICLDFETTGLDFISDDVVGISFATDNGLNCYVPFIHDGIPTINIDSFMKQAKPYLEKDGVLILAHNIKFDIQFLWNYGIDIGWKFDKQLVADTQVMSFYLDENRENHKLKYLGRSILKLDMTDFSDLTQFKKLTFNKVPIDDALEYALKDASTPLALYNIFLPQLEKEKIADAFWYMEMPFTKVLAMMERRGVYIDTELMDIYEERIDRELSELHKKLLVFLLQANVLK
jgi:DNA polymerase-1